MLRQIATKAGKLALKRAGLQVRRAADLDIHQQRRILLDTLGVTLVVDVGANVGQYAGTHLRQWTGYQGKIASFEPGMRAFSECHRAAREDDRWTVHDFGLSDEAGTYQLNVPEGSASVLSSLSSMTAAGKQMAEGTVSGVEQARFRRLDDVVGEITQADDRVALKLDVQGHEAAVLRGGPRALEQAVLLECEMPLLALYEDQESFSGLLHIIAAAGFFPVGMRSNYIDPATGFAMDADAFFVHGRADA